MAAPPVAHYAGKKKPAPGKKIIKPGKKKSR